MENSLKLMTSVVMVFVGIWLLLPAMSYIKEVPEALVWWPNLVSVAKGVIPLGLLLFGGLLFWIEFDEFKASRNQKTGKEFQEKENEDEMPEFEDVEYKDLECPECGEDFKTDIGLKVHRKVNHPDEFEENPEPEAGE